MSKINGDKSRFHIARKRNIARRAQGRKLLELSGAGAGTAKEPVAKSKKG